MRKCGPLGSCPVDVGHKIEQHKLSCFSLLFLSSSSQISTTNFNPSKLCFEPLDIYLPRYNDQHIKELLTLWSWVQAPQWALPLFFTKKIGKNQQFECIPNRIMFLSLFDSMRKDKNAKFV